MAIEVHNHGDKHTYENAAMFNVNNGHLYVYRQGSTVSPIAVFAPGEWTSAHESDSYKDESAGPSVY
ncbi:hypothetical protein ACFORO_25850 [Amycolatopsis halotolerans]|uniref:Uncharacterized protein n=1 Tax=Amycolatopsis halotolerans TaxID=330083 RepID=A0ABV7QMQ2_9PSEU